MAAANGVNTMRDQLVAEAEGLVEECLILTEDIGTCLETNETVAWRIFLDYDRDLSTVLEEEEVRCLVKDFFGNNDPAFAVKILRDMDQPEEGEEEGDGQITFAEFLEWFGKRRAGFGPQFEAQLKIRSLAGGFMSVMTQSPFEKTLKKKVEEVRDSEQNGGRPLAVEDLDRCKEGLEKTFYEVKVLRSQTRSRRDVDEEERRWRLYQPDSEKEDPTFTDREKRRLRILFEQLLEVEGEKDRLNVDVDLPKISAILGHPLTFEENAMTKLQYEEEWDFDEFLKWWACRAKLA